MLRENRNVLSVSYILSAVISFTLIGCGKLAGELKEGAGDLLSESPVVATQVKIEAVNEVAADVCSPVSLRSSNGSGVNVAVNVDLVVTLNPLPSSAYYNDSTCATAITSAAIPKNSSYKIVYFKSTAAQNLLMSINYEMAGSDHTSTLPIKINSAPVTGHQAGAFAKLKVLGPEQVSAGSCTPYILNTTDISGSAVNVTATKTFNLVASGSGGFYSDVNCSTSSSTVSVNANESYGLFYFRSNLANNVIFVASGGGALSSSTLYVAVKDATEFQPSQLVVDGPKSFTKNACSAPVVVKALNAGGVQSAVASNTVINLSGQGSGAFYSTPDCSGVPVASITIPSGSSSQSFYFKDGSPESLTFIVDDAGTMTATSWPVIVYDTGGSVPVKLSIAGPSSSQAGQCSSAFTLKTADGTNADSAVTGATTVNLTGAGNGSFYTASDCSGSAITNVVFSSGEHTKVFYYKNNVAELLVINFDDPGSLSPATKSFATSAAITNKVGLSGPTSISVGECKAYSVTLLDTFNNLSPSASGVGLSLTGGSGSFYSDASCSQVIASLTLGPGQSSALYYYKPTAVGSVTLAANDGGSLVDPSLNVTISNLPPSQLVLTGPGSMVAGTCAVFTLQLKNTLGLDVNQSGSNLTVNLSNGGATGNFYSGTSCGGGSVSSVDIAVGTSSVQFSYRNTVAQTITLTAASNHPDVTYTKTVSSGVATKLALTGPTTLGVGACSVYTVQTQDALNNSVNQASPLAITLSGQGGGSFYSDPGCALSVASIVISTGSNSQNFYYKANSAQAGLTFSANDSGALADATLGVSVQVGLPVKLLVTAASSMTAGQCVAVTVTAADSLNNPAQVGSSTTISFSGLGSGTFYTASNCGSGAIGSGDITLAIGESSKTIYFRDTAAESLNFTFQNGGLGNVNAAMTVQAGSPSDLLVNGPTTTNAGTCVGYVVQTTDSFGNVKPVSGAAVLNLSGQGSGAFFSDALCTTSISNLTIASGTSSKDFYFKSNAAASHTLTLTEAGFLNPGTKALTVNALSATELLLVGDVGPTVQACTPYTIYSSDSLNNLLSVGGSPLAVSLTGSGSGLFYSDSGCSSAIATINIPANQNSVVFYFQSNVAESLNFQISASGRNNRTKNVVTKAMLPNTIGILGSTPISAGTCASYVIQMQDALGNPSHLSSDKVFSLGGTGSGAFYNDSSCSSSLTSFTLTAGQNTRTVYYKANEALSTTLAVDDAGLPNLGAGSFGLTVTAAGASSPTKLALDGASNPSLNTCAAYVVVTQAANGTSVDVASNLTVSLSGGGSGAFYTDSGCTASTASVVVGSGTSVKPFYFKTATEGSFLFVASASGMSVATRAVTVASASSGGGGGSTPVYVPTKLMMSGPGQTLSGACAGQFTLYTADSNGQLAPVSSAMTVNLSDGPGSGSYYSDSACTSSITSVAFSSGDSIKNFYYKNDQAEGVTLSATTTSLVGAGFSVVVTQSAMLSISREVNTELWSNFFYKSFGTVSDFKLYVTNVGQTEARSLAVAENLAAPFSFKGGSFPGQGGTCSDAQTLFPGEQCSMVVRFQPTSGSLFPESFTLSYSNGTSTLNADHPLSGEGSDLLAGRSIAAGHNHTCMRFSDMSLKCWGKNTYGQLGVGNTTHYGYNSENMERLPWTRLSQQTISMAAGADHTCAVNQDGQVSCWGLNSSGQLGNGSSATKGTSLSHLSPSYVNLGTGKTAISVAVGANFSCAILNDGKVKCWGNNDYGQLGLGDKVSRGTSASEMGDNLPVVDLGPGRSAVALTAGGFHTCALLDTNSIKCWGRNFYGQLGLGDTNSRGDNGGEMGGSLPTVNLSGGVTIRQVVAGYEHTCAILVPSGSADAEVRCWGRNDVGQLGIGDNFARGTSPSHMGTNLKKVELGLAGNPSKLALGGSHSCVLLQNGSMKCWGGGSKGQLGYGNSLNLGDGPNEMGNSLANISMGGDFLATDIAAGFEHTCAFLDNRELRCWGRNDSGQLGHLQLTNYENRISLSSLPNSHINNFSYIEGLVVGPNISCAIFGTNSVGCWGTSSHFSDMQKYPSQASTWTISNVKKVVVGDHHICARNSSNQMYCWGANDYGQLGTGDYNSRSAPVLVNSSAADIAAYNTTTCYAHTSGSVFCIGRSDYRQAGNTNTYNTSWSSVTGATGITKVSLGSRHACGLVGSNGNVYCWGTGTNGQLGRSDSGTSMYTTVAQVNLSSRTAKDISLGEFHSCALLSGADDGKVVCWGAGSSGQLGNGNSIDVGDAAGEMAALTGVDLGTGLTAKEVIAGSNHTCAILSNDRVKCWGAGSSGQLGNESPSNVGTSAAQMGDSLPYVAVGSNFRALMIAKSNASSNCGVFYDINKPLPTQTICWGSNVNGQLGDGGTTDRGSTVGSMSLLPLILNPKVGTGSSSTVLADYQNPGTYSFVVPDGVTSIEVQIWGGGGASGADNGCWGTAIAGAASGGYSKKIFTGINPGKQFSLNVGAGGVGVNSCAYGGTGGQTWFDSTVFYANGGSGSYYMNTGGTGGTAGGGDVNISGNNGTTSAGANGAASPLGGVGGYGSSGRGTASTGGFPGGGAGGAAYGQYYVSGGNGRVLVKNATTSAGGGSSTATITYTVPGVYVYTVPAGVYSLRIQMWGAGGGGAGGNGDYAGSGGGSGAYVDHVMQVTPGQSYLASVGAGGSAGAGGTSSSAGNGADSRFGYGGEIIVAGGGKGGCWTQSSSYYNSPNCDGGVGLNAVIIHNGTRPSTSNNTYGTAGASAYLGGAGGAARTSCGTGNPGAAPGGAGGGGTGYSSSCGTYNGGIGGDGKIIVTPFFQ